MKKDFKNISNYKYLETVIDLKNKRTVQITYLSLTFIALIFFGLFAINPTISTIAKLQKQLSDNKFVEEQLQRKINNLTSLQQSYASLQGDLPIIKTAVPTDPQAPTLLALVQSIGQSSGITITSSQVFPVQLDSKVSSITKYGNFTVVMSGEGSKENINQFINSLTQMQRIISLDQITVSKKSDDSTDLEVSVRGSGYYKP